MPGMQAAAAAAPSAACCCPPGVTSVPCIAALKVEAAFPLSHPTVD